MGESEKQGFQLSFNRFLRVGFQGSRVTSQRGIGAGAGVGRAIGIRRTRRTAPHRPAGKQCAILFRGPGAAQPGTIEYYII